MTIYEINTVTWLRSLSLKYGFDITLSNVPDEEWQAIANLKFNAIWLMGVWQRSNSAIKININDHQFMDSIKEVLADYNEKQDLMGSAYSISDYSLDKRLGDKGCLKKIRLKLNGLGLKLILDFVPNHVALDHPWAVTHPEYFIQGSKDDLLDIDETKYVKIGSNIIALGRDPEFEPWNDVLQINAFSESTRKAQSQIIASIAEQCDGIRCDMAMLMLNFIFSLTWKDKINTIPQQEYWQCLISMTKKNYPNFMFIAESYWETQEQLINLGFDYCYDKEFYDYLVRDEVGLFKQRLNQPLLLQNKYLRFIENHDEPRVASLLSDSKLRSCAIILMTAPGAKMLYEGQLDGKKTRTPVQLSRDPIEPINLDIRSFYSQLLILLPDIIDSNCAWSIINDEDNKSVISFSWQHEGSFYLMCANWDATNINHSLDLDELSETTNIILNSLLTNTDFEIDNKRLTLELQSYQSLIFKL